MANKYPRLVNILTSVFSVDVGFSEEQEDAALQRAASSEDWKADIRKELLSLFNDESIALVDFLENDEYEAYPAEDEEEARGFLKNRIWDKLFPNEDVPNYRK